MLVALARKMPMKLNLAQCLNLVVLAIGLLRLVSGTGPAAAADLQVSKEHGADVYKARCSVCHGANLKGVASTFPSLIDVNKRLTDAEIKKQIRNGKGRMLAFPDLSEDDLNSLLSYLKSASHG
jgi:mono/diheme cytochrome c family protein